MTSMRRISYDTYSTVFGVAYLCLVSNVLLLLSCAPEVLLLATTDPTRSWPSLAVAAPLCAPGVAATFVVFSDHADGGTDVLRSFVRGWASTCGPAFRLAAMATGLVVILLVDIRALAGSAAGVALVPALAVLVVISLAVGGVGLVAVAHRPRARLATVVKVSAYLALRHWYLVLLSLAVLVVQLVLFASAPALALGLTASPALYLAWTNGRYLLRPALDAAPVPA